MNNVDDYIATVSGWQQQNLITFRKQVHKALPAISEDIKWGVPVFLLDGTLICAMSIFKNHTKYNFFNGASIDDPHKLFNSGLDSKLHRSINLSADETVNNDHLGELINAAARHATS